MLLNVYAIYKKRCIGEINTNYYFFRDGTVIFFIIYHDSLKCPSNLIKIRRCFNLKLKILFLYFWSILMTWNYTIKNMR